MRIQLSDHFSYRRILRFALPSMIMMVFTSIYGVVDGLFVSNFVGKEPFAAINLIMPILMIVGAFGFMMGAGGTAIVAKTLGEGEKERANRFFSFIVFVTAAVGIFAASVCILLMPKLSALLGAEGEMLDYCVRYGRIVLCTMPCFMLGNLFQSFFIAAEKPTLGLASNIIAGLMNVFLDALLVWGLKLGIEGAACATGASQLVVCIIPLVYFSRKNDSLLRLTSCRFEWRVLLKSITNGSSELMSNISSSIVTVFYNLLYLFYLWHIP